MFSGRKFDKNTPGKIRQKVFVGKRENKKKTLLYVISISEFSSLFSFGPMAF